jgi:hypothetical protein
MAPTESIALQIAEMRIWLSTRNDSHVCALVPLVAKALAASRIVSARNGSEEL